MQEDAEEPPTASHLNVWKIIRYNLKQWETWGTAERNLRRGEILEHMCVWSTALSTFLKCRYKYEMS